MTTETLFLVIGAASVVVALSTGAIAWAVVRLSADLRRTLRALDDEVAPTLRHVRAAAEAAERVALELTPRIERLDALADETEATLARAREGIDAAVSIVRGPADVMEGARRTVQSVGQGLASGADRLRRRVTGEDELPRE